MEYSEGDRGPEATVFEVIFPPGQTPNILLEESQPGNKVWPDSTCLVCSMIDIQFGSLGGYV